MLAASALFASSLLLLLFLDARLRCYYFSERCCCSTCLTAVNVCSCFLLNSFLLPVCSIQLLKFALMPQTAPSSTGALLRVRSPAPGGAELHLMAKAHQQRCLEKKKLTQPQRQRRKKVEIERVAIEGAATPSPLSALAMAA